MSAKAEAETGDKLDVVKWVFAWLLLGGGIVAFYHFESSSVLLRVVGLLICAGIALFAASRTGKGRYALGFLQDTHIEVRKVVWPSRQETVQTTAIVLLMVVLISIMIWAVDSLLFWIVQMLTGQA